MRIFILALLPLALTACKFDETISGYTDKDVTWTLVELDAKPFTARATISFPSKGEIAGQAPCNVYSGRQSAPLPWFKAEQIVATEMACTDLAAEQRFFAALDAMTLAEVLGDTIILTDAAGREMVFRTAP